MWLAGQIRLATLRAQNWVLLTLRGYLVGSSNLRFCRGGRDSRTMLYGASRCGRAGAALTWCIGQVQLTTLRAWNWVLITLRGYLAESLCLRFCRGAGDSTTMSYGTRRSGRVGAALMWFAGQVRLATLRA